MDKTYNCLCGCSFENRYRGCREKEQIQLVINHVRDAGSFNEDSGNAGGGSVQILGVL